MRVAILVAPLTAVLLTGCNNTLEPADIAGQYTATTFTTADATNATNVLAAGGSIMITLAADGSTTGELFVPESLNDGTPFTASMAGTFTLTDKTVEFDQTADTFMRDMEFRVDGRTLTSSQTFSGTLVSVVLTR